MNTTVAAADMERAIRARKTELGDRLVILTHHYQRPEIVALGDLRGDSYELSKLAAQTAAEWIMFCGVHFMAQAAAVLARPEQRVVLPNHDAGCPMADMAAAPDVNRALDDIARLQPGRRVVPLAYMNTLAEVKAVVGERGGAICTSSNARQAFDWAYQRGDVVLFVPDEYLGRNTARQQGLNEEEIALYDPQRGALGGCSERELASARLVLWGGYCHVHTWFRPEQVDEARRLWPGCQVHVHPECRTEVVARADGAGSTGYLVRMVEQAGPGSTVIVGTEFNLVRRLALEHPDRRVLPLDRSLCPNMARTTTRHLLNALSRLPGLAPIAVDEAQQRGARLALERMLEIGG
ncbi:MAG: quinolinate synthase NadA [Deltaproteobacteria bacterium]|nr:quinolinate synthase NadA [Deltaproteobacteria bacterium]